jgi:hypothetical protein
MEGEYSLRGGVVGFEGSHEKGVTSNKRRSYMRMKECAFFAEGEPMTLGLRVAACFYTRPFQDEYVSYGKR